MAARLLHPRLKSHLVPEEASDTEVERTEVLQYSDPERQLLRRHSDRVWDLLELVDIVVAWWHTDLVVGGHTELVVGGHTELVVGEERPV